MRIEWIEDYLKEAEQMTYDNKVGEAMRILYNLLYAEPGYGSLHNVIGWAHLYYTGELNNAERHLKLAAFFDKTYAAPYLHLGALYTRQERYAEAIEALERGAKIPAANRVIFMETIAQAYELKRDYAGAIRYYKLALAGTVTQDAYRFTESIKRVRKKRWVTMFTF